MAEIVMESIPGEIVVDGDVVAVRLLDAGAGRTVQLFYALVSQGPEHHILPSVLLDDWGNEIGGRRLYQWIADNGQRFPRAELFGVAPSGAPAQFFLRDLELLANYPVYAADGQGKSKAPGRLVSAALIPDAAVREPQRAGPPDEVSKLLRRGQVSWWRVPPGQADLAFVRSA